MRIRDVISCGRIGGDPLLRAGGAGRELPLVLVEVLEEAVVPLNRVIGPGALEAAGDRVATLTGAVGVVPADPQILGGGSLRLWTDVGRRGGAVGLAEGVATDDERNCLLVVHRHAAEGFANVPCRGGRVRG